MGTSNQERMCTREQCSRLTVDSQDGFDRNVPHRNPQKRPDCFRHLVHFTAQVLMLQNLACTRRAVATLAFWSPLNPYVSRRFYATSKNKDIINLLKECASFDVCPFSPPMFIFRRFELFVLLSLLNRLEEGEILSNREPVQGSLVQRGCPHH